MKKKDNLKFKERCIMRAPEEVWKQIKRNYKVQQRIDKMSFNKWVLNRLSLPL